MPRLALMVAADERGTTAIEYALIAALISIVFIGAIQAVGTQISTNFFGPISAALAG
jgi:pilus assembly protein Flp/PilA